jgi:ferric-dicitrate binding protein FerR (iron transport regulator)
MAARPVVKSAWARWSARKPAHAHAVQEAAKAPLQAAEKASSLEASLVQPTPEGTPVARLKGDAVALCSSAGKWYEVDSQGRVMPSGGPEEKAHIGMPLISAGGVQPVAENGAWIMKLGASAADLEGLFPLQAAISTEVATLLLDEPGNVRILTHDGTMAWLGQGHLQEKEARLAAVLADLAPRGKKSWQIDLRYEDSAVVRVASR